MLGIGKQIAKLTQAANTPNIAGKASPAAMQKARSVAMGSNSAGHQRAGIMSNAVSHRKPRSTIRGSVHPGNSAGWKGQKSVLLAPNNTGYGSAMHRAARDADNRLKMPSLPTVKANDVSYTKKIDYRIGRYKSDSPSRLQRRGL